MRQARWTKRYRRCLGGYLSERNEMLEITNALRSRTRPAVDLFTRGAF